MSEYSLDSLESIKDDFLEKRVSINSDNDDNLRTVKSDDRFIKKLSSQLNSVLITSSQTKGKKNYLNSILEKWILKRKRLNN